MVSWPTEELYSTALVVHLKTDQNTVCAFCTLAAQKAPKLLQRPSGSSSGSHQGGTCGHGYRGHAPSARPSQPENSKSEKCDFRPEKKGRRPPDHWSLCTPAYMYM